MKYIIPIVLCLLCTTGVLSAQTPAPKPDGGSVKQEQVKDQKSASDAEPEYEPPEKIMFGEWQGFLAIEATPFKKLDVQYCFLPSGTWVIKYNTPDTKDEPQGWYKVTDSQLYLQPHEAAEKEENSAIIVGLQEDNKFFVIPDLINRKRAVLFIKANNIPVPTNKKLDGAWRLIQQNPESGETREAPYTLILKEDGSYRIEQPDEKLPEEWSSGTYSISNNLVQLKNAFSGQGVWNSPSFFLFDGKLRYNSSDYFIWGEKKEEKDSPGQPEIKNLNLKTK